MAATIDLVPAGEAERRTRLTWRELLRHPMAEAVQDERRRWWFRAESLDRIAHGAPIILSAALPADDLDRDRREVARLVTTFHRAGCGIGQGDKARSEALEAIEALHHATQDNVLRGELALALQVLPKTVYIENASGSWTATIAGLGSSTSREPVNA